MGYAISWFVVFCLLIGWGIVNDNINANNDERSVGYIMMSLIWPAVVIVGVPIALSYLFFKWLKSL